MAEDARDLQPPIDLSLAEIPPTDVEVVQAKISWRSIILLSASHLSSSWSDRTLEFAVPLYLITLFPDTLFPSSFYGFLTTASAILFSNAIGRYVDRTRRLKAVRTFIVCQKFSVVAAYAIFLVLFQDLSVEAAKGLGWSGNTGVRALFALICILGCSLVLATVGINVAIERDWVTTVTMDSPSSLTRLNAFLRRIDLLCKLLAPLFVSFLTLKSYEVSVIVLMAISFVSMFFEFVWIQLVYNEFPILVTEQEARLAALRADNAVSWSPSAIVSSLKQFSVDWREFSKTPVFPTSVSISLLYITTIAFDSTFLSYVVWRGYSNTLIAGMRGLCVLMGLLGTFMQPLLSRYIGNIRAGSWSIWSEFVTLLPVLSSFFIQWPSSAGDTGPVWNSALLFTGMALSRPGLWSFDLSQLQILQDKLRDHPRRNALTALQFSLQNVGDLAKYVLVMILSSPTQFRWTVLVSIACVFAGALVWTFVYARKERGHLLHMSFIAERLRQILSWIGATHV